MTLLPECSVKWLEERSANDSEEEKEEKIEPDRMNLKGEKVCFSCCVCVCVCVSLSV